LDEQGSSGTAGGLVKYKNEILRPVGARKFFKRRWIGRLTHYYFTARQPPEAVFILNSDICGDLPVEEMVHELEKRPKAQCLLLTTEATREQSTNYGCVSFLKLKES
jgi:NDP-sugar pyrophosphorylase family protein